MNMTFISSNLHHAMAIQKQTNKVSRESIKNCMKELFPSGSSFQGQKALLLFFLLTWKYSVRCHKVTHTESRFFDS